MKIGFDISQTGKSKAGCGYFAESLIRHLAKIDSHNQYFLYPTFGDWFWDPDWAKSTCQIHRGNFRRRPGHQTFTAARYFWSHPTPDWEHQLGHPQIIHSNNFFCPVGLNEARLIYTLYDLSFLEHPEWTTEENRIGCFTGAYHASLYADLILAISQYSRDHFLNIFPHYPPERIAISYPASRFSYRREFPRPPALAHLQAEQFWLSVGVLEPRKNHPRVLQAYARFKDHAGCSYPFVFAGGRGWLMEDFEKTIKSLHLQDDILLLGYVDDGTLQWLYQNCAAFIYPSLFEGFGMPVLEAMTLGAPVITSNCSSIPEIVGDAGVLIDPHQEEEIFSAMRQLAGDPDRRRELREKGMQKAAHFSWEKTAATVLACYEKALLFPKLKETFASGLGAATPRPQMLDSPPSQIS